VQRAPYAAALAAVATLGVLVAPASAASPAAVAVRLPPGSAAAWRVAPPVRVPAGVQVLGLAYRGRGTLELRAGSGAFTAVDPGPASLGRTLSEPVWIGNARTVTVRARGAATDVSLVGVVTPAAAAAPASASRALRAAASAPGVPEPAILPRSAWGANESLRRGAPVYFPRLKVVFVHHTDSANGYTRGQVPALIRGFYAFHVRTRGWNDIGYDYLIDAYGRIWEGRYGGVTRNVRGAHTEGFNTGSAGVALIGTYDSAAPTAAQTAALRDLLAWRLDLAHLDPLGTSRLTSHGTAKYPSGQVPLLNVISGHRDAVYTDCPGNVVYRGLPALRRDVAALPSLRIYDPVVAPAALDPSGGPLPIRFGARLSTAAPWRVSVLDAAGTVLRTFVGAGASIDVTWSGDVTGAGARPPLSTLQWRIEAGTADAPARPASGAFDDLASAGAEAALEDLDAAAAGGGWRTTFTQLGWSTIAAAVTDAASRTVAVLDRGTTRPPGRKALAWSGTSATGRRVPSGRYHVVLRVAGKRGIGTATVPLDLLRGESGLTVTPAGVGGPTRPARVVVRLRRDERVPLEVRLVGGGRAPVVLLARPATRPGPVTVRLDPASLADGRYALQAIARTAGGTQVLTRRLVLDRVPPAFRGIAVRSRRGRVTIRGRLSEAASAQLVAAGSRVLARRLRGAWIALVVARSRLHGARTVRLVLRDALGNQAVVLIRVPRR
jgi:hypothetical protein